MSYLEISYLVIRLWELNTYVMLTGAGLQSTESLVGFQLKDVRFRRIPMYSIASSSLYARKLSNPEPQPLHCRNFVNAARVYIKLMQMPAISHWQTSVHSIGSP